MTTGQVARFVALLLGVSWAGQGVGLYLTGLDSPNAAYWLIPVMFTPALVTLVYVGVNREYRARIRWRPGRPALLVVAPLIPAVLALMIVAVVMVAGWGRSAYFAFDPAGVSIDSGPWVLGTGDQNWILFAANIAVTALAYGALSGAATIGEELGWRGFLQGILVERYGMTTGIVSLGLIWAAWHLPIMLAGYNYPEYPVPGALVLFPALLIGASFLLAWITIRAGSFWPAVLAHGGINSVYQAVIGDKLLLDVPRLRIDLLEILLFAVVALACWAALARNPDSRGGV